MTFNQDIHHRRSIRLRDYDYVTCGAYFLTICTWERECLFGEIASGMIRLSEFGTMVADCWRAIPAHFSAVALDEYVIMPNHLHGIIVLNDASSPVGVQQAAPMPCQRTDRAQHAAPLHGQQPLGVVSGSLGAIVRSFKSAATKRINATRGNPGGPIWQRNYYDRIIRSDRELERLREYVLNNPLRWGDDENNLR